MSSIAAASLSLPVATVASPAVAAAAAARGDPETADSLDHVKIIRHHGGGGYGKGHGIVLGDAHKGHIGYGGGGGHGGGYGGGHGGGYGGGHGGGAQYVFTMSKDDKCPSGVNPILGLALLAGLAAATAVLFTVITMMTAGKRRRRRGAKGDGGDDDDVVSELINHVTDMASAGKGRTACFTNRLNQLIETLGTASACGNELMMDACQGHETGQIE